VAYIKNADQLLAHGNTAVRKVALDIIEYALAKADPYNATMALIKVIFWAPGLQTALLSANMARREYFHGRAYIWPVIQFPTNPG
jgi:hypothetical protein